VYVDTSILLTVSYIQLKSEMKLLFLQLFKTNYDVLFSKYLKEPKIFRFQKLAKIYF
jgi:hypothetical protein